MSSAHVETRVVRTVATGARACVVVGLLLLVIAVYLLVCPIEIPTQAGAPFRCGTAASPAVGDLASTVCSGLVRRQQLLAGAFGAMALIIALGGLWVFGMPRRTQRRVVRDDRLFEDAGEPAPTD